ncbi:sigma-54-dependent transcriptional regulator [Sphingomonas montana]|uniref:sigma-54-dependent transcriptional regulator n=1 Tax=Sphingomonas montana TaxID=1843236 RepID=UPI00096F7A3B|nr:sigma-54 dependent transcriptional regulator [Sphingomonas montana]
MAEPSRTLLLIDDEPAQGRLVSAIVARAGWRTVRARDADEAIALLGGAGTPAIDAALIDRWAPGDSDAAGDADGGGGDVAMLRACHPTLPILMIAASPTVAGAVAAMRTGATDFLVKPLAPDRLLAALDAATDGRGGTGELRPLAEKLPQVLAFDEIVGSSSAFRSALAIAAKAARARVSILIEGESGVGKEVVAQAIHAASPRARRPLVVVNCGGIPQNLIESELFGHERGAFTGAFDRRIGRFEQADTGTLFLDEVGELSPDAQVRLLRVLQSGEVTPIGARGHRIVDVRVIAATNRTLLDEVAAGRFREDLYYRLAVVSVAVPPLRTRIADVPALARHMLARIADQPGLRGLGITDAALALLMRYDWPGNVRQLHNALFRAAILCDGDALTVADFPQIAAATSAGRSAPSAPPSGPLAGGGITLYEPNGHMRPLDAIEADVIRLAIGHYRGRMTEVARRLGIGRSTLYRKLSEMGIDSAA